MPVTHPQDEPDPLAKLIDHYARTYATAGTRGRRHRRALITARLAQLADREGRQPELWSLPA